MPRSMKWLMWIVFGFGVLFWRLVQEGNPLAAMLGDKGLYWLLLGFEWAVVAALVAIWAIEFRKLRRMEAEYRYRRTLKGAALVKYLTEKDQEQK